jgi:sugar phosphate isomerase/epimerase
MESITMNPATRRAFLTAAQSAAMAGWMLPRLCQGRPDSEVPKPIRIGSCQVDLDQARAAGLEGVELNVGGPAEVLAIATPDRLRSIREGMDRTGLPVCSLMMALLNDHPLATDARAPRWLEQAIDAAADLGARVVLVAFFGKGDLLGPDGQVKADEQAAVIDRLRAAAPRAADRGVILGVENYLNASQNGELLDRVGHEAVRLYYDAYNTGATKGYDAAAEIRALGPRIAQIHFKNGNDYLDSGELDFAPVARALRAIGYEGWVILETSSPSGDVVADARRNAAHARKLLDAAAGVSSPAR